MVIEAARKNVKIAEIPITYYPREGESKLSSFADGWRHLRFMMLYRPTPFLLGPGLIAFTVGIILTLTVAIQEDSRLHTLILGSLLLIIGYQMLLAWIHFGVFGTVYGFSKSSGVVKKIMSYHSLRKRVKCWTYNPGSRSYWWSLCALQLDSCWIWIPLSDTVCNAGFNAINYRNSNHIQWNVPKPIIIG